MIAAIITSEENQRRLEPYREIVERLALARGLDERAARALAAEGKAVVWIDFGLHSNEVAPAQASPEIAYRVATEESRRCAASGDDVIFILVPSMNPDGLDKICAWYQRNLGTPYEVAPMVELYHSYAGHDNNRDWYMFNMPESRNVAQLLYSRVVSADRLQPAPDGAVPRTHLRAAVRRPDEPEHPAAGDARHRERRRRHHLAPRGRGQNRRHQPDQLRHLVERRHAHRSLLPQHGRHPHRDGACGATRRL